MSLNTSSQTRLQTINNLPRYKIDTPGQTAQQSEFILFCSRGCNLNLNLSNATNLTLKNSNKQLIITANGNQKIGWSGSGANGLRDVNFDLKEIIITAPQKYILSGEQRDLRADKRRDRGKNRKINRKGERKRRI